MGKDMCRQGGDSGMSGLLTLLTVIDILSKKTSATDYRHRLAFAALSSEPWDYMGSRRMIVEMTPGDHAAYGEEPPLNLSSISKVRPLHSHTICIIDPLVSRLLRLAKSAELKGTTEIIISLSTDTPKKHQRISFDLFAVQHAVAFLR